jgi:hypothetical protein
MKRLRVAAVAGVAGLVLAGCGGGSSAQSGPPADLQARMEQMQSCLVAHGVQGPAPGSPPPGASGAGQMPDPSGRPPRMNAKTRKAFEACGGGVPFSGAPPAGVQPPPG